LVQGYGRSIRSKEDYAITYVLDSGFEKFVKRNKNILPDWFTQAVQPGVLEVRLGHAAFVNSSKVLTSHNAVINNHYNSSIVSEQTLNNTMAEKNEVACTTSIKMPSDPSETLTSLDKYIEDESNRQERFFICPYCPEFKTPSEIEYQHHIVLKHRGKPGYPNMASGDSKVAEGTTGCTEEDELFTSVQT
jgi:hypothetical protein